jgi:hypothetical protein
MSDDGRLGKISAIILAEFMLFSVFLFGCGGNSALGAVSDSIPITDKHKIVVNLEDAVTSSPVKTDWSNADKLELWQCLRVLTPCDPVPVVVAGGALVLYAESRDEIIKMTFRETSVVMEYQDELRWFSWDEDDYTRFGNCVDYDPWWIYDYSEEPPISMIVAKHWITAKSAKFLVTNNTDKEYLVDQKFTIHEKGGLFGWKGLHIKTDAFSDEETIIPAYTTVELFVEWESRYGTLNPGTYRLTKICRISGEKNTEKLTVEFMVDE